MELERQALKTRTSSGNIGASSRARRKPVRVAGLDLSPELVAIALVYLVQGILGLARLAVSYFLKDELHLDPATVGILSSVAAAPWVIKPIYGFLSDSVPLFGYKRRSYLILTGALGAISWLAMATIVDSPTSAVAWMMVGSLGTACSDVVVDSIVVERSRGEPQVAVWGTRSVFAATAVFPLLVCVSALLIDEKPVVTSRTQRAIPPPSELWRRLKDQTQALGDAITQSGILLPATFVFLWQATPSADTAMFYFYTNSLGFDAEFMGRIRLLGSLASLAGVGTYNFLLKEVPLRRMFFWTAVLGTLLGLTQLVPITGLNRELGISNEFFVLGDSVVLTVLAQVSFMPILVLAARLCPEGVEATLFAALMSILNGGAFAGSFLGSLLTRALGVDGQDFTNLAPLVLICTLSSLAPLALLRLVPNTNPREDAAQAVEEGRTEQ
jgi:Na+/melibiose symporter-like transporter